MLRQKMVWDLLLLLLLVDLVLVVTGIEHGGLEPVEGLGVRVRCRDHATVLGLRSGGTRGDDPGVLGTTALGGVHDHLPLLERDTGQATGHDPHFLTVIDDEGSQVDVTGLHALVRRHRRHGGQLHQRLGDPATRIGQQLRLRLSELLLRAHRPHDDAFAAGAVNRLDDQLVHPVEDLLPGLGFLETPGVDVGDQRLLVEVVTDEIRYVGVDQLVVGHSVADRVGDGDGAVGLGGKQTGDAEQGVRPELHRVDELVVDTTVDDMDLFEPPGGAQEDDTVADHEVAPLHQRYTHGAGEHSMHARTMSMECSK